MKYIPGDLIFYPDDGKLAHRFFTKLQEWGNEMGAMRNDTSMTHVGMISTEPDLMIDMKWPRPRFSFIADDQRTKIVMRPKCDDLLKLRAIYWCYFHINDHYSFLNMLIGKFGASQCHKVCSGWVDMAYREAGFPITRETDKLVSPNELVSSPKLEMIEF